MYKEIIFGIITYLIISIFFNNYFGKNLFFISQSNKTISIVNNQFVPYNLLEKDNFNVECIVGNVTETTLNNKKNTIQYYLSNPVSFICNNNFYKGDDGLNNLIELQNNVLSVCFVQDSSKGIDNYFCSSK